MLTPTKPNLRIADHPGITRKRGVKIQRNLKMRTLLAEWTSQCGFSIRRVSFSHWLMISSATQDKSNEVLHVKKST